MTDSPNNNRLPAWEHGTPGKGLLVVRKGGTFDLVVWQNEAADAARFHADALGALGLTHDDIALYMIINPDGKWTGREGSGEPSAELATKVGEIDPRLSFTPFPPQLLTEEERARELASLPDIDF